MTVLLDTHALIWALLDDPRLSEPARAAIQDANNEVLASAASVFEIATKERIGKLGIAGFEPRVLPRVLERSRIGMLAMTSAHALAAGMLDETHRDPFDRMLMAQCHVEGLPLITRDAVFEEAGVSVIW